MQNPVTRISNVTEAMTAKVNAIPGLTDTQRAKVLEIAIGTQSSIQGREVSIEGIVRLVLHALNHS